MDIDELHLTFIACVIDDIDGKQIQQEGEMVFKNKLFVHVVLHMNRDKYDDENEERVIYYKGKSANVHPIRCDPCCR